MKIYLDTKDLISMLEHTPALADRFENKLREGGHELILSVSNVLEIAAPLLHKRVGGSVMALLNRLEAMPIRYISEARLPKLELLEAVEAFNNGREFLKPSPFCDRFDYAITLEGEPETRVYLRFSLAEIVFTIWREDPRLFDGFDEHTRTLRRLFELDRALSDPPTLQEHFIAMIERKMTEESLTIDGGDYRTVAEWIHTEPQRCPAIRAGYEVYHMILKNTGDMPRRGDIIDWTHITCAPYVDIITLDRRMRSYTADAFRNVGFEYDGSICADVEEVLSLL